MCCPNGVTCCAVADTSAAFTERRTSRFCLALNFYHCSTSIATYVLFIRPCLIIVKQRIWSLVAFWIALTEQFFFLDLSALCTLVRPGICILPWQESRQ
ncbi:hypothetical protein EDC04DRAFT_2626490, partial [Pisolithus marmoratus]